MPMTICKELTNTIEAIANGVNCWIVQSMEWVEALEILKQRI